MCVDIVKTTTETTIDNSEFDNYALNMTTTETTRRILYARLARRKTTVSCRKVVPVVVIIKQ